MGRRTKPDGKPLRADVPVWVLQWSQHWVLAAAASKGQAQLLALGWAYAGSEVRGRALEGQIRVRRARESDLALARAMADAGDEPSRDMLTAIGRRVGPVKAAPTPDMVAEPERPVEVHPDQVAMFG